MRLRRKGEIGQSAGRAPLWGMAPKSGSGTQRSVQPWGETIRSCGPPPSPRCFGATPSQGRWNRALPHNAPADANGRRLATTPRPTSRMVSRAVLTACLPGSGSCLAPPLRTSRTGRSVGLGFKDEAQIAGFAGRDCDLLGHFSIGFVPGGDGVLTRGKGGQGERAAVVGDRKVRVFHDGENAAHPGMQFAADADELGLVVLDGEG